MNVQRRIRISRLVFDLHRAGTYYWWLIVKLLYIPATVVVSIAERTTRLRFEKLTRVAATFHKRADSVKADLHNLDHLTEVCKHQVLAARSALLEENKRIQASVSELRSYRAPGAGVLIGICEYAQHKMAVRKRKTESFERIIDQAESSVTFYWDLLLWLVIGCEELMGDMGEEYLLRTEDEGEAQARAWYQEQVIRTISGHLWRKIERLAAIGTIIDFMYRLFRK